MNGPRTTLVILFGGQSAEHDVSCVTASHVMRAADPEKYDIIGVGISRAGSWHRPNGLTFTGATARNIPERLTVEGPAIEPSTIVGHDDENIVVLPMLHGPLGEDGTVQGMLELMGVPYAGSGVLSSAIAMDKGIAKQLFAEAGIPQANHRTIHAGDCTRDALSVALRELGGDVFVKPANMGSSVGVSHADTLDAVVDAVTLAAKYDNWIIIEETVRAREIEVSVLGNRAPRASLPGEITPSKDFYDYEDKYEDDAATLTVPAHLTDEQTEEVRGLALRAYRTLRCEGMARVDFFFEENGRGFLCNEINTIPGFTPISMYPKMWQASGLSYPGLIDELVELAIERHGSRKHDTSR